MQNTAKIIGVLVGIGLSLLSQPLKAADGVRIQAHYQETTGGGTSEFRCTVTLMPDACQILATNVADPKVWENITYDGINTYLLTPRADHVIKTRLAKADLCGLVMPGKQYYMIDHSSARTFMPWIVFCLHPQDIIPDKMMPPWSRWRTGIGSFGWRWTNIVASPDGRFLKSFRVVRDKSLDLAGREFLRSTYEYPITPDLLEDEKIQLRFREVDTNGFIQRTYFCTNWFETNDFTIPANAQSYYFSDVDNRILASYKLEVDKVALLDDEAAILPPVLPRPAYVKDYRYTRRDEQRIFRYAEYVSADWKSDNDSKLLGEADWFMKHGPKIGDFGLWSRYYYSTNRLGLVLSWLGILSAVVVPPVIIIWISVRKGRKQSEIITNK